ncbi:hypothetical protein BDV34DRAFT_79246 [Aspergillus parasiticus]|uniref:Uncharacterized protein n=1 Tax=Aspergillus parasiticus TaxID=5067 RepID=A0A5N6DNS8_ASPPA|nr:hypothetical protein BDV34DRAFT_79246 [Aspergillus parasiticus]
MTYLVTSRSTVLRSCPMRLNDQRKRQGQFPDLHLLKGKKKIGEPVRAELAGECVGNDDRFLTIPVLFFVLVWIESREICAADWAQRSHRFSSIIGSFICQMRCRLFRCHWHGLDVNLRVDRRLMISPAGPNIRDASGLQKNPCEFPMPDSCMTTVCCRVVQYTRQAYLPVVTLSELLKSLG